MKALRGVLPALCSALAMAQATGAPLQAGTPGQAAALSQAGAPPQTGALSQAGAPPQTGTLSQAETLLPPAAATEGHQLERADLEAWLDGMVPYALKSGEIAGAVVAVVKDGTILLEKGYGYADVSKHLRMDPEQTLVRIGSTSKLFTWIAVLQLVEQGKLDLNRDVNDYLDFKIPHDFGKPVTLRDLMNHRGGFEEGLKDVLRTDIRDLPSTESYLKEHPRPMLFPPGDVPAYSNYGASVAGYIVQRVSGEPYEQYVERHILAPLGMSHTTFEQPLPKQFANQVSNGYRTTDSPPGEYEQVVTRPAGSGTATAADMSKFMIALLNEGRFADGQILRPATMRQIENPPATALPGFASMSYGFFHERRNNRLVLGHGGDTVLFHTEFDFLPEEHVGILYTFNSRGREDSVYQARAALFDGFLDRYFPDPPAADSTTLPSAVTDAQAIAGRYESSRRIVHGFLSIFSVLQQTVVRANADGTISLPRQLTPGLATYAEIGPQLWREKGGTGQISLQIINGTKTIVDSSDPTSVLQEAPISRSTPLNVTVMLGALIILILTALGWILSPVLRQPAAMSDPGVGSEIRRLRLHTRIAAVYDLIYMTVWLIILQPVLNLDLGFYSSRLDPVIRTMQVAGVFVFVAAGVGLWSAWRLTQLKAPRSLRIRAFIAAAGLVGVLWIAVIGGLTRFSLNY